MGQLVLLYLVILLLLLSLRIVSILSFREYVLLNYLMCTLLGYLRGKHQQHYECLQKCCSRLTSHFTEQKWQHNTVPVERCHKILHYVDAFTNAVNIACMSVNINELSGRGKSTMYYSDGSITSGNGDVVFKSTCRKGYAIESFARTSYALEDFVRCTT